MTIICAIDFSASSETATRLGAALARRRGDKLLLLHVLEPLPVDPVGAGIRLADWDSAGGPYDLVFSNPPYIPAADIESLAPDVARFEPRAALNGGPDGLDAYRALAGLLPGILPSGGYALLEIGLGQANAMEPLFRNLEFVRIAPDLSGTPRCVILRKP